MSLHYHAHVLPVSFWMQVKVLIITFRGLQGIGSVYLMDCLSPICTIWERLGLVKVSSSFEIQEALFFLVLSSAL